MPASDTGSSEPFSFRSQPSAPEVAPDLDEIQALALAARTVLQTLPAEEQRRILEQWLSPVPPPTVALVSSPDGGVALISTPVAPRLEVDLLTVVKDLRARYGTSALALSAFFLGTEPMERARKRLRLAPERIGTAALTRVLRRRERPLLRQVREAERWMKLYSLAWPVDRTWRVTSHFGQRLHPILGVLAEHRGIDIAMPVGTEVRAPADGVVTRVLQGPVNGQWIELNHGSGMRTYYCHLSSVEVKRGQQVKAGELVARSGDTGRVTGPHLHYQVKLPEGLVDPLGSRAPAELVAAPWVLEPESLATLPESPRSAPPSMESRASVTP